MGFIRPLKGLKWLWICRCAVFRSGSMYVCTYKEEEFENTRKVLLAVDGYSALLASLTGKSTLAVGICRRCTSQSAPGTLGRPWLKPGR
jgi:hypothetical protein